MTDKRTGYTQEKDPEKSQDRTTQDGRINKTGGKGTPNGDITTGITPGIMTLMKGVTPTATNMGGRITGIMNTGGNTMATVTTIGTAILPAAKTGILFPAHGSIRVGDFRFSRTTATTGNLNP